MFVLTEWPNLNFSGLELISYTVKPEIGEESSIKITECFPKIFKFRSLNILKEEVSLHKYYE